LNFCYFKILVTREIVTYKFYSVTILFYNNNTITATQIDASVPVVPDPLPVLVPSGKISTELALQYCGPEPKFAAKAPNGSATEGFV
jgi:hypothetical protein